RRCGGTAIPLSPAPPRDHVETPWRAQMIHRVLASQLAAHVGETVQVSGWLHRRRELKNVTFLILRDRSGLTQAVLPGTVAEQLRDIPEETVLSFVGTVTANEQAPGGVEVVAPAEGPQVELLSSPAETPPLDIY